MRIVVHLPAAVAVFRPTERQIAALRAALPQHAFQVLDDESAFLEALPTADAVVVWRFEAEWYERAARLLRVFTPSAGRERIARDPAGKVAVQFGTFHGPLMAESLLAMIGFMNRRLDAALFAQLEHAWRPHSYVSTRRLAGQVALIVGFGAIGRHCARLLRAVGMTIHGVRRNAAQNAGEADRMYAATALHEAVELAHHVICILPSDTGTDHLLDRAAFERMQRTAYIYNLGRGNAIDEQALLWALRNKRIAGAFLDVFAEEPLPRSSLLWGAPNLYVTPHSSAIMTEYLDCYFEELQSHLSDVA